MSDRKVKNSLESILEHISAVQERVALIQQAADFVKTTDGEILLDAIVLRLQVIGENIKQLKKRNGYILENHPDVEWNQIVRFRDIISHHYELLNHEIIFTICKVHIPKLKEVIIVELKSL